MVPGSEQTFSVRHMGCIWKEWQLITIIIHKYVHTHYTGIYYTSLVGKHNPVCGKIPVMGVG
jgi:hypothetical protein